MKVALAGLPRSGKSTLFQALSGTAAPTRSGQTVRSVISVGDDRLAFLSSRYHPKKTTPATVEFVDPTIPPAAGPQSAAFSSDLLVEIRQADALALVLRAFPDSREGPPSPLQDYGRLREEMFLADLITIETRIERIQVMRKKGRKSPALSEEETLLRRFEEHLGIERPLSALSLSPAEKKLIQGYGFLTLKPFMVVLSVPEAAFGSNGAILAALRRESPALECAGLFEMELAAIEKEEDRRLFMEDIGITESARDRLTRLAHETVGYISFFTVGSDEVRAWNLRRGLTARDAAGVIHSDLARGFIRAECFHVDDLKELGSEKAIREKGRFRLEGRDYRVKDGDILSIRSGV